MVFGATKFVPMTRTRPVPAGRRSVVLLSVVSAQEVLRVPPALTMIVRMFCRVCVTVMPATVSRWRMLVESEEGWMAPTMVESSRRYR